MMFEGFFEYMWWDLIPIISIPILIQYINNQEYGNIHTFCLWIIAAYFSIWIAHFFIRKWDIEARFSFEIFLIQKYLRKVILRDSTSVEKMGTGKVQAGQR
jgi:hypothetical protein